MHSWCNRLENWIPFRWGILIAVFFPIFGSNSSRNTKRNLKKSNIAPKKCQWGRPERTLLMVVKCVNVPKWKTPPKPISLFFFFFLVPSPPPQKEIWLWWNRISRWEKMFHCKFFNPFPHSYASPERTLRKKCESSPPLLPASFEGMREGNKVLHLFWGCLLCISLYSETEERRRTNAPFLPVPFQAFWPIFLWAEAVGRSSLLLHYSWMCHHDFTVAVICPTLEGLSMHHASLLTWSRDRSSFMRQSGKQKRKSLRMGSGDES